MPRQARPRISWNAPQGTVPESVAQGPPKATTELAEPVTSREGDDLRDRLSETFNAKVVEMVVAEMMSSYRAQVSPPSRAVQ